MKEYNIDIVEINNECRWTGVGKAKLRTGESVVSGREDGLH